MAAKPETGENRKTVLYSVFFFFDYWAGEVVQRLRALATLPEIQWRAGVHADRPNSGLKIK